MNAPPPYAQPQAPYPPQPQHQGPPPKKGMSGCLIALLVVGGLLVLGGIGVAIAVMTFMRSDEGKKIVSAVSSGAQIATEAATAPGTNELRAIGCHQASVLDTQKIDELAAQLGDGGHATASGPRLLVTCQVQPNVVSPTCDMVASTYVKAVGRASGEFAVSVSSTPGSTKGECGERYTAEGARMKR